MNIGELIKSKINEKGGKQLYLADEMPCSESKISRICQNKYIKTKDLIPICIHLEYNFFNDYAKYVDTLIPKGKDISLTRIYKFVTTEEMYIGKLIQKIKLERKLTTEIFANKIGCSERNVYKLYKKENMDTHQLIKISKDLNFNLFDIYAEYIDEQIQKKKDAFGRT